MRKEYLIFVLVAAFVHCNDLLAQVTWGSYGGIKTIVSNGVHLHTGHLRNTGVGTQISNNGDIYVRNDFNQANSATFIAGGMSWLWFQGTVLQTISGDAPILVGRVRVDNSAGARLTQSLIVPANLEVFNGNLNLNDFNIDLGTTGSLVEDRLNNHLVVDNTPGLSESNVGGYVRATNRTTNGLLNEIAGLGIFLTDAGIVNIDRYHYDATMGGTTIMKNYEITGTPSNTTMRIEFAADEALGVSVNSTLKLLRFNGTIWEDKGGTWVDLPVDYVQQTGILSFSPWSVGNPTSLPVTLLEFQATRIDLEEVLLEWETATEINNAGFEIEKSFDGLQFDQIGFIVGAVNSYTPQAYKHTTAEPNAAYYRLRQVDQNGGFDYSEIRFVDGARHDPVLVLYPNPTHRYVKIGLLNSDVHRIHRLEIIQSDGKLVAQFEGNVNQLQDNLDQVILDFSRGIYLLRLETAESIFVQRLVLN
ncbi:MAG: T9SS type A sorting domain-containing protein [Bacteroidetes bacterium]|nr:T9SS type A sorting domain-containing protein [Bacteroidota bacterium]MBP8073270.1 T9SS type A sorting domain-containing protein [Bacteroidia bacterium]